MSPLLRKRDSTVVQAMHNPDGSWFEMLAPDDAPPAPVPVIAPPSATGGDVRQFLREIASRGGKARAARHSREELAAWGRVRRKPKPEV
jgi:hypothetical protein